MVDVQERLSNVSLETFSKKRMGKRPREEEGSCARPFSAEKQLA